MQDVTSGNPPYQASAYCPSQAYPAPCNRAFGAGKRMNYVKGDHYTLHVTTVEELKASEFFAKPYPPKCKDFMAVGSSMQCDYDFTYDAP